MGDPSDPAAVCDEEGKVLGTRGLRVVDASLMPDCPRANTQATTYMMSERVSGIINFGSLEAALRARWRERASSLRRRLWSLLQSRSEHETAGARAAVSVQPIKFIIGTGS